METEHFLCESYWCVAPTDEARGSYPYAVCGPVVGVKIDPAAKLVDPQKPHDLGYEISFRPKEYFATLDGDAAVVLPTSHLVLGPVGMAALVVCGLALIFVTRRAYHRSQDA